MFEFDIPWYKVTHMLPLTRQKYIKIHIQQSGVVTSSLTLPESLKSTCKCFILNLVTPALSAGACRNCHGAKAEWHPGQLASSLPRDIQRQTIMHTSTDFSSHEHCWTVGGWTLKSECQGGRHLAPFPPCKTQLGIETNNVSESQRSVSSCGRKMENLESPHTHTRESKLHTERPQAATFSTETNKKQACTVVKWALEDRESFRNVELGSFNKLHCNYHQLHSEVLGRGQLSTPTLDCTEN